MILILSSASASAFDGQGTESDPYLIKNINDWNQLGNDVNDGGNDYHKKYFRLTADITINTYYLDQRIGIGIKGGGKPFRGTFDGNNHSITVSYGTSGSPIGSQYAAPFSVVDGATIKKLTIAGPVFTNVTVKYSSSPVTVDGVVSFIGTYGKSTFDAEDTGILFLGIDNTLYYPMNSAVIGAQRAFFQLLGGLTTGDPNAGVREFKLNFGEGEKTGIKSIDDLTIYNLRFDAGAWFTLDGRRLQGKPTKSGVYVCGGRKIVVK